LPSSDRRSNTHGRAGTAATSWPVGSTRWLIGLPRNTVTTGCNAVNVCTARTRTFDYHPNGNLKTTVVQPGSPEPKLTIGIVYDTFGNPTSVTRTDNAGVSRTDATEYGTADKLYPPPDGAATRARPLTSGAAAQGRKRQFALQPASTALAIEAARGIFRVLALETMDSDSAQQ
jgi:hypothetical protein